MHVFLKYLESYLIFKMATLLGVVLKSVSDSDQVCIKNNMIFQDLSFQIHSLPTLLFPLNWSCKLAFV